MNWVTSEVVDSSPGRFHHIFTERCSMCSLFVRSMRSGWVLLRFVAVAALVFGALILVGLGNNTKAQTPQSVTMPEFTNRSAQAWINSPPLRQAQLRGKVVLLDVFSAG
jgi:hypothetical protein